MDRRLYGSGVRQREQTTHASTDPTDTDLVELPFEVLFQPYLLIELVL